MAANYKIKVEIDDSQANQSIASINRQIAQIGASTGGGSAGVSALNAQLQQIIAQNPAVANVIKSLGATGQAGSTASGGVRTLAQELRAVGAAGRSVGGAAGGVGALGSAAQAAASRLAGMTGSLGGIATAGLAIGATAAIGGLIAMGSAAVSASAKFESYRASLTTVLGDSDKAAQAFDRLTQFAAKTPFSLDQSVQGFIKLKALGLQPSEAALTSYGNTASAMGKDLNQMVEAVADAATGEFERLKEFGIKSSKQGNDVAFTFQGVTTKVKNNSTDIQAYLMNIGNTNFAGAMDKQSKTFNGILSNLSDTVEQTFAKIGDGGLTKSIGQVVGLLTSGLSAVTPVLVSIGNLMGGVVTGLVSIAEGAGTAFSAIFSGGQGSLSLLETLTVTFNVIGQVAQVTGRVIGAAFGAVGQVIGGIAAFIRTAFQQVWTWLGGATAQTTSGMGLSFLGVLRAAKFIATSLPQIFSAALGAVGGMFAIIGKRISAFLGGDWNAFAGIGGEIASGFGKALGVIEGIAGKAKSIATDTKGAAVAWERMKGGTPRAGGASLADLAGAAPKIAPQTGKGAKDKKDGADAEAKKLEERLKKEREYFQALDATATVAAMLPQQAELYNKELELRKIRGDGELKDAIQLNQVDRDRISNALKLKDTNEIIRNIGVASLNADIEALYLKEKAAAQAGVSAEKAAENLAVEEKLWPFKEDALRKGISLSDAELQKQLAILDAKERQNFAIERQNQLKAAAIQRGADYGIGAIAEYGTKKDKIDLATKTRDDRLRELNAAKADGKLDTAAFNAGVKKAGVEFRNAVAQAGSGFASKFADLANTLADMIGGKVGEVLGKVGNVGNAVGNFADTKNDVAGKITDLFGDTKSGLVKGIGAAVGGAMAGLKIGEAIGGLGKALGLKHFETGAKIGGAVGGLTGNPIIAAAASVIGGLIQSIFYKAPSATATIAGADPVKVTGNKAAARDAVSLTAASIQKGLQSIASQLGGTVGSFAVSIGKREDYYRVIAEGGRNAGAKHPGSEGTLLYDGQDEAKAIAIAIQNAIEDGAITGISGTLQKALTVLGTEGAVAFAQNWASVMDDYDAILNPVASAIKAVNAPIDALKATLVAIGDTTADQAKLELYRQAKIAQVMKEQTKTFTDLLATLNGEGVGITALSRLNADLAKFAGFKSDIAAGKQVNQEDFATLVNKIIGESKDVYGTSTAQAEAIRQSLIDATTAAQKLVLNEFNTPANSNLIATNDNGTTDAINAGTDIVATRIDTTNAQMAINNAYQGQILEAIQTLSVNTGSGRYLLNARFDQV